MNTTPPTYDEWMAQWGEKKDADARANRLFNDGAIDRIVTAVGKPPSSGDALAEELERVARIYSVWDEANDQPPDGEIREGLVDVVNGLRKARMGLTTPLGEHLKKLALNAVRDRHDESQVRHAIDGVMVLEALFGRLLREQSYGLGRIRSRSVNNWLIGEALPRVYEQHFDQKFGMSRDKSTGIPSGPGIRFIIQVLSVMGVTTRDGKPFGAEAIEYYTRPDRS